MSATDTLIKIVNNNNLFSYDFRYCLVDYNKHPFRLDGNFARPNHIEDFSTLQALVSTSINTLERYQGIGVSVQASNICAIDIDHCIKRAFDETSITELGNQIVKMFDKVAYIEFSFSGTGIRIFFKANKVKDYNLIYYTKNSNLNIEYYYPEGSNRYVTITGQTIKDNDLNNQNLDVNDKILVEFLDKYMKRKHKLQKETTSNNVDSTDITELMKKVKYHYMTNNNFQDIWFSQAPGSGHDESERDYHLIAYIYDYITKDKDKIKQIFEQSPFYKSKDYKHINKWTKQDFRYYNYLYNKISNKGA